MSSMTSRSRKRLVSLAMAATMAIAGNMPWTALASHPAEADAVMAAVVYKITKFVTWPETTLTKSTDHLVICIDETDAMLPAMRSMDGRMSQGRIIEVRLVTAGSIAESGCHVLFMGIGNEQQMSATLEAVVGQPVLTVGNVDGFVEQGGIVGLRVDRNRVGFIVNTKASARAGIGISAQLLQLATLVTTGGGP
jgi:hypothetical protein